MAALQAVEGGFGEGLDDLEDTLKLLWCHYWAEQSQFERIWREETAQWQARQHRKPPFPGGTKSPTIQPEPLPEPLPTPSAPMPRAISVKSRPGLCSIPLPSYSLWRVAPQNFLAILGVCPTPQ